MLRAFIKASLISFAKVLYTSFYFLCVNYTIFLPNLSIFEILMNKNNINTQDNNSGLKV